MERLQEEYTRRMQQLSAKMMANMNDQKLVQEVSSEIASLSSELQAKMQKLLGM